MSSPSTLDRDIMLNSPPFISVIVPVYMGREWIAACLQSFRSQSLRRNLFEILFVFNGPEDGSPAVVEDFVVENPDINIQLLHSHPASASHARNIGAEAARGAWVTWVDCDDRISEEYLELMYLSAREGVVPLAQIVDVDIAGVENEKSIINTSILEHGSHVISPSLFPRALSFMTCKLVPRRMALEVEFDESLRSGEDVALFAEMYSRFSFDLTLLPAFAGAKYYRLIRESSVSRQGQSFDFMVTQRLQVISSLNRSLEDSRPEAAGLIRSFINSQASFVKRYCRDHPEEMRGIHDLIATAGFLYFPWGNWFDSVDRLVIAFNFLPYADTGAMVMAKRIRSFGKPVDVVMHAMDNVRSSDARNRAMGHPYVQFVGKVQGPAYFASSVAVEQFCRSGVEIIGQWTAKGRQYSEVYSRAMWPASHFLAALHKLRNPNVRWIAEFSDPIRLTTNGDFRTSQITGGELFDEILSRVSTDTREVLKDNMDLFFWAEHLAYSVADEVVFTNENQRSVMLEYADPNVRARVFESSCVVHQPTLGETFYNVEEAEVPLEEGLIHVGYFGEFYETRGLGEVVRAMHSLPAGMQNKLRLHVFTSNSKDVEKRFALENPDAGRMHFHSQLPYFQFLNMLTRFNCLIVNDAVTKEGHSVNPYLPSKYSDYRGAGTKIWALVESGSVLSKLEHDFVSSVGDVKEARDVLTRLAIGYQSAAEADGHLGLKS